MAGSAIIPIWMMNYSSGAIVVEVELKSFTDIITKAEKPLVITILSGVAKKEYKYLTIYRGFIFFTRSKTPLELPREADVITAKRVLIGEMLYL